MRPRSVKTFMAVSRFCAQVEQFRPRHTDPLVLEMIAHKRAARAERLNRIAQAWRTGREQRLQRKAGRWANRRQTRLLQSEEIEDRY